MTLAEIVAEAKRLDEAATKGPWHAGRSDMVSYVLGDERPFKNVYGPGSPPDDVARAWGERCIETAQFIAFARTALPRLARVAAAAVKMRSYLATPKAGTGRAELDAIRAFDAAVRGDRLPQPDGQEGKP